MLDQSFGLKKKNHSKSRNRRPWYPNIYTAQNVLVLDPVFLYAVTMLIFQIKKIISSEKWFSYVVTFFFFLENAKQLGRSDDAKRRKKEDGLKAKTLALPEPDHKDLVQIWLIKNNADLSGKSRISTAFKPNKSTARSAAKNRDFKTA